MDRSDFVFAMENHEATSILTTKKFIFDRSAELILADMWNRDRIWERRRSHGIGAIWESFANELYTRDRRQDKATFSKPEAQTIPKHFDCMMKRFIALKKSKTGQGSFFTSLCIHAMFYIDNIELFSHR